MIFYGKKMLRKVGLYVTDIKEQKVRKYIVPCLVNQKLQKNCTAVRKLRWNIFAEIFSHILQDIFVMNKIILLYNINI